VQKLETALPGVLEIHPNIFRDVRGFFMESYHREKFAALGIRDCNTRRPHSALGYRPPAAPAAYSQLVPPNSLSQPMAVI
jgi:hypothetical protein